MKKLTNSYHDFQMINLSWGPGGRGPYLVRQVAYPPGDETFTVKPFILQNDGTWIQSYHLACLPEEEQEQRIFTDIEDMLEVIERIGSEKPVVNESLPEGLSEEEVLRRYKASVNRIMQRMESAEPQSIPLPRSPAGGTGG